jgi:hypothetical protein
MLILSVIGYQHTISLRIPEKEILFMVGAIGNCPYFSIWLKDLTDRKRSRIRRMVVRGNPG